MKNILILLSVLIVFGAVYFLFVHNRNDSTTLDTEESAFSVKDTAAIGKIILTKISKGKQKDELVLARGEKNWVDGEGFNISQPRIKNFLSTLMQLYVRNPIQDQAQKSALTILKKSHTEVTVLDRNGKQMKKYFIGPQNNPQTANIMLLAGAENAYLVSKPGFQGYISIQYTTDRNTWRERLLFNYQAENLAKIQLEYKNEDASFALSRDDKNADWSLDKGGKPDPKALETYLSYFNGKVFAESYAGERFQTVMDTLMNAEPDIRMELTPFDGKARAMRLFVREDNPNNYFGWMEDEKTFYTIQRSVIDKFVVPVGYFQKPA